MAYNAFITDLKTRLESIDRYDTDVTAGRAMLKTVWTIGQRVYDYTRETATPIKEISQDAGAAAGAFEKYVRFYKQYPDGYTDDFDGQPVNWSHYAALLYVGDKTARDFYLKNAALHRWSSHELRRRISCNFYENHLETQAQRDHKPAAKASLRPSGQRLFTYAAKVLKVIDADTLLLEVDVGFFTRMEHKVRLRGINAPEKGTKKGDAAKAFVERELLGPLETAAGKNDPWVIVRSYKTTEKFGRYLVDIWYLQGETDKERVLAEGKWLNQLLLDQKLAVAVE